MPWKIEVNPRMHLDIRRLVEMQRDNRVKVAMQSMIIDQKAVSLSANSVNSN